MLFLLRHVPFTSHYFKIINDFITCMPDSTNQSWGRLNSKWSMQISTRIKYKPLHRLTWKNFARLVMSRDLWTCQVLLRSVCSENSGNIRILDLSLSIFLKKSNFFFVTSNVSNDEERWKKVPFGITSSLNLTSFSGPFPSIPPNSHWHGLTGSVKAD